MRLTFKEEGLFMSKITFGQMPSPPEFLLKKQEILLEDPLEKTIPESHLSESHPSESQAPEPVLPKTVDATLYQSALADRQTAEMNYAEIYSQYLDVVSFNEKLLRSLRRYENYQTRVRKIYDRAKIGDQIVLNNLKLARRDLAAADKTVSDLQIENESMRVSLTAHEEAFQNIAARLAQAESAMSHANRQFQLLSDEYENRGVLLDEADRKIRGYLTQISQLGDLARGEQKKSAQLADENLILNNQIRELQIKEAGVSTLNNELTESIIKLQKQIHLLEDKRAHEREEAKKQAAALHEEIARLRDGRYIDGLVEKSKQAIRSDVVPAATSAQTEPKLSDRQNWNHFYNRWSQIIDELSSHSAPIRSEPKAPLTEGLSEELISERGDLDFR